MERKIGEIFEYNGEWYQCVGTDDYNCCKHCDFHNKEYDLCDDDSPQCLDYKRADGKNVIFKKLEKVGKPYTTLVDKTVQNYLLETAVSVPPKDVFTIINNEQWLIAIEIKQNKENMEEQHSTENYPKEDKISTRIANKVGEYIRGQLEKNLNKEDMEEKNRMLDDAIKHYDEIGKSSISQECSKKNHQVRDWLVELKQYKNIPNSEKTRKDLKPFDLQKAREGKPVCTRDGRKARIICFDAKGEQPIIALFEKERADEEIIQTYNVDGSYYKFKKDHRDLMMLPEKKEGWVNVYRDCDGANITKDDNIYSSKDAAIASAQVIDRDNYVATTIIMWEE